MSSGFLACSLGLNMINWTHQTTPAVTKTMLYNDTIHQELCEVKDAARSFFLFLVNCFSFAFDLDLSVANHICCLQQNVQRLFIWMPCSIVTFNQTLL